MVGKLYCMYGTFIVPAPHSQGPLGKKVPRSCSLSLLFHRNGVFISQPIILTGSPISESFSGGVGGDRNEQWQKQSLIYLAERKAGDTHLSCHFNSIPCRITVRGIAKLLCSYWDLGSSNDVIEFGYLSLSLKALCLSDLRSALYVAQKVPYRLERVMIMRYFHRINLERVFREQELLSSQWFLRIFRELADACDKYIFTGGKESLPCVWQAERRETNLVELKFYRSLASVSL